MSPKTSITRITLVGLVSLAIAMGVGRFAFTPLLPLMQDDGLATIGDGGVLAAVHFVGYWLGAVFSARLGTSPKTMLRLSLLAIGICTLGMGLTDSFALWLIFRFLCGVFSAVALVLVSNFYIKHLADAGRAEKQGWVFSGVGAGIAVAGLGALAIMVSQAGSVLSWQIFGAVTLIAALAVCTRMGLEIPQTHRAAQNQKSQPSPLIWAAVIAYGAAGLGYIIPATYLPVMAREIVQSPLVFGWSWPVFGAAAFLSTPLAARLDRHFTNRQIWAGSQVVMAVGLLLPIIFPHILAILVAGVCVGGTFMIITMTGMKEMHRLVPPHDVMRHIAILTAAFATGQIIGPLLASALYELTGGFSVSLAITSVILVLTAIGLVMGASNKAITRPLGKI